MALRNALGDLALDASVKAIGTNPAAPLFTAPSTAGAVSQSRFRLASSGRVVLTSSGNLRAHVINAANTDGGTAINRSVQILRLGVFTTAVGWAQLYVNPTTGLPASTTRRPRMNALMSAGTATAPVTPQPDDPIDLRIDTNASVALAGGVDTGITFGLPASARTNFDLPPFILTPGQSLGINLPFAAPLGGSNEVSMSLYWAVV